jgi:PadR family transcriptional regulator PadR
MYDKPMRRTTKPLVQVAAALLERPADRHWGYDLSKRASVRSGVLYPMLTRMLNDGWVKDGWEGPTAIEEKRPPRRYYVLTEKGKRELATIVGSVPAKIRSYGVSPRIV